MTILPRRSGWPVLELIGVSVELIAPEMTLTKESFPNKRVGDGLKDQCGQRLVGATFDRDRLAVCILGDLGRGLLGGREISDNRVEQQAHAV
jgi:hypothetical protein